MQDQSSNSSNACEWRTLHESRTAGYSPTNRITFDPPLPPSHFSNGFLRFLIIARFLYPVQTESTMKIVEWFFKYHNGCFISRKKKEKTELVHNCYLSRWNSLTDFVCFSWINFRSAFLSYNLIRLLNLVAINSTISIFTVGGEVDNSIWLPSQLWSQWNEAARRVVIRGLRNGASVSKMMTLFFVLIDGLSAKL